MRCTRCLKGVINIMKISCMKNSFLQGINIVMKAVSNKTTHPILSCILIEAANGKIKLTANDMEIGIESYIKGNVTEGGKVALDAKLLSDIIKKFPDSEVFIDVNEDFKTTLRCEKSKFVLSVSQEMTSQAFLRLQRISV